MNFLGSHWAEIRALIRRDSSLASTGILETPTTRTCIFSSVTLLYLSAVRPSLCPFPSLFFRTLYVFIYTSIPISPADRRNFSFARKRGDPLSNDRVKRSDIFTQASDFHVHRKKSPEVSEYPCVYARRLSVSQSAPLESLSLPLAVLSSLSSSRVLFLFSTASSREQDSVEDLTRERQANSRRMRDTKRISLSPRTRLDSARESSITTTSARNKINRPLISRSWRATEPRVAISAGSLPPHPPLLFRTPRETRDSAHARDLPRRITRSTNGDKWTTGTRDPSSRTRMDRWPVIRRERK